MLNIKHTKAIILLIISNISFAQNSKLIKNPNYDPLSTEDRLKKFPFNETSKVKIVSYNLDYDGKITISQIDISEPQKKTLVELSEIINKDNLPGIIQSKTLTFSEIIKLSDILYNTCSKYIVDKSQTLGCYEPRNAILFCNENDNVFEYIEICFECRRNQTKPEKINEFAEFCSFAYEELKLFFKNNGIETEKRN